MESGTLPHEEQHAPPEEPAPLVEQQGSSSLEPTQQLSAPIEQRVDLPAVAWGVGLGSCWCDRREKKRQPRSGQAFETPLLGGLLRFYTLS